MANLEKNQLHTVTIEGYTAEGLGVARVGGEVVFVHGGVRGETCVVKIMKVLKHSAFARVEEILERSPARREPDCPHYPACGGCDFRHLSYEEELEAKRRRVEDALRRLGGADIGVETILGAEETDRYRNKVQFPVQPGPDGPRIGFYRARSHDVVDVPDCRLQRREAGALAGALWKWMEDYRVPAYNERNHAGLVRHLFLRFAGSGVLCCLVINGREVPRGTELVSALRAACPALTGVALSVNTDRTNVVLGREVRTLWGRDWLEDELCGLTFRLSIPSFYQVNRRQCERLYGKALEFAGLTGEETVLDLYCGIGTISLVMARKAKRVVGVEIVPQAVADAGENARRNGVANAEFWCGDAAYAARRLLDEGLRPDVVVVDPPRKGLAAEVVETIAQMAPRRVVYVSCDPGTLARDVKRFAELGYRAERAGAVDMFPRTAHVETVCLLSKPLF